MNMSRYSTGSIDGTRIVHDWFRFFSTKFVALAVVVGLVTRIVLLFIPPTVIAFTSVEWLKIFGLGFLNDAAFAVFALAPAFLLHALLNDAKYNRIPSYLILGVLGALTIYSFVPGNIFAQYGSAGSSAAKIIFSLLLSGFLSRVLFPGIRSGWRKAGLIFVMLLYVFLIILNALSECFFWYEFGARYNFIAVNYLVYTNEAIGNILKSHPILPMFAGVLLIAVIVSWRMFRTYDISQADNRGLPAFLVTFLIYAACFTASLYWLHFSYRHLQSENTFATELQCNGCWNFLEAYSSSTLPYEQFYAMLPEEETRARKRLLCGEDGNGIRAIRDSLPPVKKNIVLIAVESLSADFLSEYGNTRGITPNLDTLMQKSLVFDRMYAAGNRSARGLEALTLCLPPSAGESIIKRPDNADLFSTGKILREFGYSNLFLYGGDSHFDNMKTYFSGNGYEVLDKGTYPKKDIIFSNIRGACDEDTYRVALNAFDWKARNEQLFHALILTISNNRPYTYPEGRITYSGDKMSREAAVKYTDYAIGKFLAEASQKSWFRETVFVVVANHCASSAGETDISVERYHIPAIVYAPGFIAPGRIDKVCSQIDLMPTLFSMLHFSYDSRFYGRNILDPDYRERAFMATYQDLGYYADGVLTVLSPVERIRQFRVTENPDGTHTETEMETPALPLVREAQVFYQSVNLGY